MQFHAVSGTSVIRGGSSRANTQEATAIAQWILANQQQLLNHYQDIENSTAAKEKKTAKDASPGRYSGYNHPLYRTKTRAGPHLTPCRNQPLRIDHRHRTRPTRSRTSRSPVLLHLWHQRFRQKLFLRQRRQHAECSRISCKRCFYPIRLQRNTITKRYNSIRAVVSVY